jgi:uncharacterized protein
MVMAAPLFQARKNPRRSRTHLKRFAPRLVIMVRDPAAGRVKTRLARAMGTVAATAAYRAMMTSVCARLATDPRWETSLAVTPDGALRSRMLPNGIQRSRQSHGDLGQRLQAVMASTPPGPVAIIGTDIPGVKPSDIARAFKALSASDAVFGPAPDGGYWLVGLKRRPSLPCAFKNVRWSTSDARADTEANLRGRQIAYIGVHDDVDEASDFASLRHLIGRRVLPATR